MDTAQTLRLAERTVSKTALVGMCIAVLAGLALPTSSPASVSQVTLATQDPDHELEVRPRVVSYTGDGTGYLGGGSTSPRHQDRGGLHWRFWKQRSAFAIGDAWINNCRPSCANGHFDPHRATVRVRRPRHGHFTRMTIRFRYAGRQVIDHRALNYIPATAYYSGYYVWGICGTRYTPHC